MVYVPQGAFYAGDNATSFWAFRQKETGDNDPWYINSENAITTTSGGSGDYYYPGGGEEDEGGVFTIPAAFPKGYAAFYIMKGEVSQNQWVRFFNLLTNAQKSERDVTSGGDPYYGKGSDDLVYRNNVSWTSGDATLPDRGGGATYAGVAMNWIAWADLAAILDWSGLRPMTELEFEKAARGTKAPVSGEYAWGNASFIEALSITNPGLPSERGEAGSNVACNLILDGPLRVGSFAKGVTNRVSSGGGFYGVMELSGNLSERPIMVGRVLGRAFQGRYHGDGLLDSSGDANVTSWPGTDSNGAGFRGGNWYEGCSWAPISDRFSMDPGSYRHYIYGGRGVRTAP
jgi:hypothetical protein